MLAMTNIFDVYELINFITDKVRNGYMSPEEVSRALDAGQQDTYRSYKQKREVGDDDADTALEPFKTSAPLTASGVGILTYPADYGSVEAIFGTVNGKFTSYVEVLHVELMDAVNSALYPIESNPRYLEESSGIQLYPNITASVTLHYLTTPTTPVIGYTVAGNTIVYNPATSIQLVFNTDYWMPVVLNSLPYIGVNLSSEAVMTLFQKYNQTASVS